MQHYGLDGLRAVVTGASSGIGAATAARLASDDARFVSGHGITVDGGAMAHP